MKKAISKTNFNKIVAIVDRLYTYDKADYNRASGKYWAINREANTTLYIVRFDNGKIYFSFRNTLDNSRFTRIVSSDCECNELINIIKTLVE